MRDCCLNYLPEKEKLNTKSRNKLKKMMNNIQKQLKAIVTRSTTTTTTSTTNGRNTLTSAVNINCVKTLCHCLGLLENVSINNPPCHATDCKITDLS